MTGLKFDSMEELERYFRQFYRLRPYQAESTGSRPISEVKQPRAGLVLGRETTWEPPVLQTFFGCIGFGILVFLMLI